eukprot:7377352-Prymnesium_polylepis.1
MKCSHERRGEGAANARRRRQPTSAPTWCEPDELISSSGWRVRSSSSCSASQMSSCVIGSVSCRVHTSSPTLCTAMPCSERNDETPRESASCDRLTAEWSLSVLRCSKWSEVGKAERYTCGSTMPKRAGGVRSSESRLIAAASGRLV